MNPVEEQFTSIAPLYDRLMSNIPYARWVDYVKRLAARHGHPMARVLDLGCGTGTVPLLMASRQIEVTGIDASRDMIEEARRKAGSRTGVSFHVSPMEELSLPDRFDTAISLFDTVNYITDPGHLQEAFRRAFAHLLPGALFIFDANTPYALEMELFTQDNLRSGGEPKYVWRSRYDWRTRLSTVDMTFYVKEGNTRVTVKETHRQRAYTLSELKAMLAEAGFETLDLFEAYTVREPDARTDRAYFVARRPLLKGF